MCVACKYCNGFDQRVARQQLCKHGPTYSYRWDSVFYVIRTTPSAVNGPMNSQSDMWHVFPAWSTLRNNRGAVFPVRGPCREDMREYGNGNWLHLSSEVPRDSSVARRIRRLSVWRYMCCSISILGVWNLVWLVQFLCYKSVARKRIVQTSGNRLRRLVWSDCKLCKSAIV
jgi:hypothetical protein